jgi:hypothetical protein
MPNELGSARSRLAAMDGLHRDRAAQWTTPWRPAACAFELCEQIARGCSATQDPRRPQARPVALLGGAASGWQLSCTARAQTPRRAKNRARRPQARGRSRAFVATEDSSSRAPAGRTRSRGPEVQFLLTPAASARFSFATRPQTRPSAVSCPIAPATGGRANRGRIDAWPLRRSPAGRGRSAQPGYLTVRSVTHRDMSCRSPLRPPTQPPSR